MSVRWIRSQRAAVVDVDDAVLLVARDGTVRRLDGDSAALARSVLAFLSQPRSDADVIAQVEAQAGPLGERRAVVRELVQLLAQTGAIASVAPARPTTGANVVVGISGAIAASHAPALVGALQRRGYTVEVALTQTAQRFVAVDALGAIAGREIHTTIWPAQPHAPVPHVALAAWAELVVIYPASGTTIGRIASGDFSDLVSAIALTTHAPVVIAPSLNPAMLDSPAVQRNLEQLRTDGHVVLHGVPSQEVADALTLRSTIAGAAAAPGEIVATLDALRAAGVLQRRAAEPAVSWDAAYRAALVPWVRDACDDDIAEVLGPGAGKRLLDVGTGLGQIARHAASAGYQVTAIDLSEVALHQARDRSPRAITWVRDDICASGLVGDYDVIVDRATVHALSPERVHAWAASVQRLLAPGGQLVVKAHRAGVPGATTGWTGAALAALLPHLELVTTREAELPGLTGPAPLPAVLAVLRKR